MGSQSSYDKAVPGTGISLDDKMTSEIPEKEETYHINKQSIARLPMSYEVAKGNNLATTFYLPAPSPGDRRDLYDDNKTIFHLKRTQLTTNLPGRDVEKYKTVWNK